MQLENAEGRFQRQEAEGDASHLLCTVPPFSPLLSQSRALYIRGWDAYLTPVMAFQAPSTAPPTERVELEKIISPSLPNTTTLVSLRK